MSENKKRFKLFDMNRDGPGVSKEEGPLKPTFWNLPKFYFRKFSKVLSLNLLMLPIWIIPLIGAYLYAVAPTTPTQDSVLYSTLLGSYTLTGSPIWSSLFGVFGTQINMPVFDTVRIWVMIGLGLLLAILWGWINTGAAYCCRSMFRGEPVFLWDDFKYAIKRNFWPSLWLGLIDFAAIAILVFDFIYFSFRGGKFWIDFMFFAICGVVIVYMFMRMYFYVMLVTFDIKLGKLLKNSLIFSILGIKRNLFALIYVVLVLAINAGLVFLFWNINIVVPIILPLIYLLPTICLFNMYFTYPNLDKYMISGK